MRAAAVLLLLSCVSALADNATTVRIPIGGGVSIGLPKGLTACDAPTRALLGSKMLPASLKGDCADFDDQGGAKMVLNPVSGSLHTISMAYTTDNYLPPDFVKRMTPQILHVFGDDQCRRLFHEQASDLSCVFDVKAYAGRSMLDGVVSSPNGPALGMILLPASAGTAIVMFFGKGVDADPQIVSILESIEAK